MMEILAPAGNPEKLRYAVYYGADAVYAAGKNFGLRAGSGNFSDEELKAAAEFCHKNKRKIYVTVNIFSHNRDESELSEYLKFLENIKVDAVIISDPGVLYLARKNCPGLDFHVSTQANITSWMSAKYWQDQGASRVILARELGIEEIYGISEKCPDLELEMFVHGAMCMSYSGRCLLSAHLNGRDANRGECSHPCRWEYSIVEKKRPDQTFCAEQDSRGTYILNSKDLCLIKRLEEIKKAGVCSLKIEGRMKSLYYAANVTRVYRDAVHQANKPDIYLEELDKVSHRVYCEGFFDGFDSSRTQYYESSAYIRNYQFLGEIIKSDDKCSIAAMRAKFSLGDEIEFIFPNLKDDFIWKADKISTDTDEDISFTKPNTIIKIPLDHSIPKYGIIRKKI
ncbi:MAG: peptidase U32 [Candidatus Cloacimonadota bacterium]|nr:MAG: peptidase U32 [Candidatus Cloacimonadota bacterium]